MAAIRAHSARTALTVRNQASSMEVEGEEWQAVQVAEVPIRRPEAKKE